MEPETIATIAVIGHELIAFVFPPWLMFGIYRRLRIKEWQMPMFVAVGSAWFLRFMYRITIELPHLITVARQRGGDDMFDGVGGNVAILMFGWLEPLIACLLFVGLMRIINRRRNRATPAANAVAPDL